MTRFWAVGFVYLPPLKPPPPAPDATEPREEANGCYCSCVQMGSPVSYRTGRPGRQLSRVGHLPHGVAGIPVSGKRTQHYRRET